MVRFAQVYYYFQVLIRETETTLALVSLYSLPHNELFENSHHTLLSCVYEGDAHLHVIDIKSIMSVVAMVPHHPFPGDDQDRYFVVEKPGLDVARLGGVVEVAPEEELE
jgi:hypothetical protein